MCLAATPEGYHTQGIQLGQQEEVDGKMESYILGQDSEKQASMNQRVLDSRRRREAGLPPKTKGPEPPPETVNNQPVTRQQRKTKEQLPKKAKKGMKKLEPIPGKSVPSSPQGGITI